MGAPTQALSRTSAKSAPPDLRPAVPWLSTSASTLAKDRMPVICVLCALLRLMCSRTIDVRTRANGPMFVPSARKALRNVATARCISERIRAIKSTFVQCAARSSKR